MPGKPDFSFIVSEGKTPNYDFLSLTDLAPRKQNDPTACRKRSHYPEVFPMQVTISVLAEIPEDLHESLRSFLDTHPAWDQNRMYAAAISLFLLQNGHNEGDRTPSRVYLDTLFDYVA